MSERTYSSTPPPAHVIAYEQAAAAVDLQFEREVQAAWDIYNKAVEAARWKRRGFIDMLRGNKLPEVSDDRH